MLHHDSPKSKKLIELVNGHEKRCNKEPHKENSECNGNEDNVSYRCK